MPLGRDTLKSWSRRLGCSLFAALVGSQTPLLAQDSSPPSLVQTAGASNGGKNPDPLALPVHQFSLEAEAFPVKSGWRTLLNGQGNLTADAARFNHISGERLLHLPSDKEGVAEKEIEIPNPAAYRLWVRYEYPAFADASFDVEIVQGNKTVFSQTCGTPASPRFALGHDKPRAQHDPVDGSEGLVEECFSVDGLKAGKAIVRLKGKKLDETKSRATPRNVDLVWLTTDTGDAWRTQYGRVNKDYPILDAFRDAVGARWEARVKNNGKEKASWNAAHVYNRFPWGANEAEFARDVEPGQWSAWFPLKLQDTCHFHMATFRAGTVVDFDLEIRPVVAAANPAPGSAKEKSPASATCSFKARQIARIYLPPYPEANAGAAEKPVSVEDRLAAIVAALQAAPQVGREPGEPLCYGGWMPLGQDDNYGRLYAELYRGIGLRSWHPSLSGPKVKENLAAVGIKTGKTVAASGHRNFATTSNVERTKNRLTNSKQIKDLLWFDCGEEIGFEEWLEAIANEEVDRLQKENQRITPKEALSSIWKAWLEKRRASLPKTEYWVGDWGPFNPVRLRPESSPRIAEINPRLYVDSLLFYEEIATAWSADGNRKVKAAFGQSTLCGYDLSLHPLYYPTVSRTIKWFRNGGSDFARHSESFWQAGQAGPLVNGYIAEHFRSGLSAKPGGVLRQYNMPHGAGNTDLDFLRSGYTHLAHGATALDFFGVGLNETFGENHIDHRQVGRYLAIRELTHSIGFVEDLLPESQPLPTGIAILASASTERWDLAQITQDRMALAPANTDFRKAKLHHHLDRQGIWTALNLLGATPDIIIEEDCTAEKLKAYRMVIVVGDCLPTALAKSLQEWVSAGGTLVATAGSGRFDPYHETQLAFHNLFGIETRAVKTTQTMLRPRADLPYAVPHDLVMGEGWKIPCFATQEQITPVDDVTVLARLESDKTPALMVKKIGQGRTYYCAFHPGIALLWKAVQSAATPEKGMNVHAEVNAYDPACLDLFKGIMGEMGLLPTVESSNLLVDRRLILGNGADGMLVPLANYSTSKEPFDLIVRTGFPVKRISSAQHGALSFESKDDGIHVRHPGLKAGDILRLDP